MKKIFNTFESLTKHDWFVGRRYSSLVKRINIFANIIFSHLNSFQMNKCTCKEYFIWQKSYCVGQTHIKLYLCMKLASFVEEAERVESGVRFELRSTFNNRNFFQHYLFDVGCLENKVLSTELTSVIKRTKLFDILNNSKLWKKNPSPVLPKRLEMIHTSEEVKLSKLMEVFNNV